MIMNVFKRAKITEKKNKTSIRFKFTEKNKVTPSVTRIGIIEKLFEDNEKSREAKLSPT